MSVYNITFLPPEVKTKFPQICVIFRLLIKYIQVKFMKKNLENKKLFQKYDPGQALISIKRLAWQCRQAQKESRRLKFPTRYQRKENIIVCGMGGSALGSDIIRTALADRLKVPFHIINDYQLPAFVDRRSLVMIISYSGTTEETITAGQAAINRGLPVIIITSGGRLAQQAKKYHLPAYIFKPSFNPSGQPRLGLGYSVISQIQILRRLNLINLSENELEKAISFLEKSTKKFEETIKDNPAKEIAYKLYGRIPVIFSSLPTLGNAHAFTNQINENAKNFACYYPLPELNHHLLEGITHPSSINNFSYLLLNSELDSPAIKTRFLVTKKVLDKKKFKSITLKLAGPDRLSQALWILSFGSFVSYYLALLNQENPAKIPWVNFFKKELLKIKK